MSTAGVAYYYGSLYPKEKLFIEELFEKRFIDTVVGTDALALGVNFPIQNVVFTQLIKYRGAKTREIGKNLFEQLSGRAGRKGFFDNGYVYYCDDFSTLINSNQESSEQINLKDLFNKLVNAQNEKVNISLNANIKDILLGNTTIEDEADFVSKFSTTDKDYEKERKRIDKTVKYVTSFDLATYYLKEILKLDIEQGFYKSMEHLSTKKQSKIERLSQSLFKLQPYFERDIGIVYLNEYSPKENCVIFLDILMETSLEKLFKRYGDTLYNLLIFRKYMNGLPKIYSKFYDLSIIDDRIDNMDYSVLHPNEFTLCPLSNEKLESNQTKNNDEKLESNKEKKNKKKLIYNVPRYLDKITINGREYVKLLVENKYILICQYYKTGNLKLFYVPLANTIYSISGVVKQKDILDILDRVDFSSIKHSQNETIEKIEGMKLSLKKNDYNLNYVHK